MIKGFYITIEEFMDNLLSYKQAAKLLGVSERTVWGLVKEGKIHASKVSKRLVRITTEAVQEYLRQSQMT